jgi:coproporphyrinogen III oxidase
LDVAPVRQFLLGLQQTIVDRLSAADGGAFRRDEWTRPEGGGGITQILEGGAAWERAGVNFSHVSGPSSPGARSRRWASRSWSIRAIPTSPPCT